MQKHVRKLVSMDWYNIQNTRKTQELINRYIDRSLLGVSISIFLPWIALNVKSANFQLRSIFVTNMLKIVESRSSTRQQALDVGEIICRVPNGLHRISGTWWERAVGAHQIQEQVGNFLTCLSLDASSCLVELGCCVKDFPCLWRDSHHDWRLKSLLSVATGFQGDFPDYPLWGVPFRAPPCVQQKGHNQVPYCPWVCMFQTLHSLPLNFAIVWFLEFIRLKFCSSSCVFLSCTSMLFLRLQKWCCDQWL